MLIVSSLIFSLISIVFFYGIGKSFSYLKLNTFKSIIIGYSILLIIIYYFYFIFNFSVGLIKILSFIFFFILTYKTLILFFNKKKILDFDINFLYILLVINFIYILPSQIFGEQFYVFRGNHWDQFSYLSIASLFSKYNFSMLNIDNQFPINFEHFLNIKSLIFSRPLTSLLISFYDEKFNYDIFVTALYVKTILILISIIAFKLVLDNFNLKNFEKYILLIIFPVSFWVIYIYEIDAYSHLAGLPIFLVLISELKSFYKFKIKNLDYVIYFSILNISLFLIYPELFIISSIIIFVYLIDEFKLRKKKFELIKVIAIGTAIFLILTLPAYKTNYQFIISQTNLTLNEGKDWWGYFGAFILGKENLILYPVRVEEIKNYFLNHDIFRTLNYIYDLHIQEGYRFFYFNLIPSFFGLYYFSIEKLSSFFNSLNFIFIAFLNIYLIIKTYLNLNTLINIKKLVTIFSIFFVFTIFIIIKGNIWTIIKLYTYLFPFIYLFTVIKFKKFENKLFYSLDYFILILLIIFPIYKYSIFNYGIGRLDSFPSIMHPEMKKNFKWQFEISKSLNCPNIKIDINDYFKKSYILLKLYKNQETYKIINNDIKFDNPCYVVETDNRIILKN